MKPALHIIAEHEFIENEAGELALLLDVLSPKTASKPVFLISRDANKAFLRRGPEDVHQINKIKPAIAKQLRHVEQILIVELQGDEVAHSYEAVAGILEDDEEDET